MKKLVIISLFVGSLLLFGTPVAAEENSSEEQSEITVQQAGIIEGQWGTSRYTFDESTGIITIFGGELGDVTTAPWRTRDAKPYREDIQQIVLAERVVAPENSWLLFGTLSNLTEIKNLNNLDTSRVTNMKDLFHNDYKLSSLDLSNFNTANVTDMSSMFYGNFQLKELDLSSFDTSKVTNMEGMFIAVGVSNLNLSSFDTSNVTNMRSMFAEAWLIDSLDLSSFNTSKVTNMEGMFYKLALKSLKLGENFQFVGENTNFLDVWDGNACDVLAGEKPVPIKYWKKVNANEWYTPEQLFEGYSTKGFPTDEYIPVQIQEEELLEDTTEPTGSSSESTTTSNPTTPSTEPTSSTNENSSFTSSSQNMGEEQLVVTSTTSSLEPSATSDDPKATKLAALGMKASSVFYQLLGGVLLLASLVLLRVNKKSS